MTSMTTMTTMTNTTNTHSVVMSAMPCTTRELTPKRSMVHHMFPHTHIGATHASGVKDFATHVLNMPIAWYAPVVMQRGTEEDLVAFVAPDAAYHQQLSILHRCLTSSVDVPIFVATPAPASRARMLSTVLLATYEVGSTQTVLLAMCDLMSPPAPQSGDLVLRHASMEAGASTHVLQIAPRGVLASPLTWAESLERTSNLDAVYALTPERRTSLASSIPTLLGATFDGEQEGVFTTFVARTHYSAYMAYAVCRTSVVDAWLNGASPEVAASLVPLLRVLLVGRLFEMVGVCSIRASYDYWMFVVTRGMPWWFKGETVARPMAWADYDVFRNEMLRRESMGMPTNGGCTNGLMSPLALSPVRPMLSLSPLSPLSPLSRLLAASFSPCMPKCAPPPSPGSFEASRASNSGIFLVGAV